MLIVRRNGVAVVDTTPAGGARETFASRPEIAAALRGQIAQGVRYSSTLHEHLLYVAVPIAAGGVVEGAVRITYPTSAVDARVTRYWLILLAIAAVVLALATVAGLRLSKFVTRPLRNLERAAVAVGDGDLATRAPAGDGPPEVRSLAAVFNETVARLEQLVRSQNDFVADASHQLRTPLTALRLRLENIEADLTEAGRRDLEGALDEVERLARLVDGLLVLARVDTLDGDGDRRSSRGCRRAGGGVGRAGGRPRCPACRRDGRGRRRSRVGRGVAPGARQPDRERPRSIAGGKRGDRVSRRAASFGFATRGRASRRSSASAPSTVSGVPDRGPDPAWALRSFAAWSRPTVER